MSPFDRLHPALQHHIVNSLGWPRLRPLQEASIDPILDGEHAILLAPTAGGKTEAACFPIFSRMLSENWVAGSVLYLCPIKALLNNLLPRLESYATLFGRRVGLWHGDITTAAKNRILSDPPDILLTTPESLEGMLVSPRVDHRFFFANVRSVIIDEVHAFAGDDRGWHLLALIERIQCLAGQEVQRLGLSATVGNPERLADWLAGSCSQARRVIQPPPGATQQSDVQLDWVGSLENAALVISRMHRGEKRLVFVDSRSRVERLAVELRARGVDTYVSHSSLSLEARRSAESAFSEGHDCVIVATSTLELGIDVGDLDRVIQVDAPFTVASFLQRIGRTGRREGSSRNCLFLATTPAAFLRSLGLLHLWRSGYVEPIEPPAMPLHLYAQQIMALALQEGGIIAADLGAWLGRMPGFTAIDAETRQQTLEYMLQTGILHSDEGLISMGAAGEETFGRRYFLELLSVFTSPPMVAIYHGREALGDVHQLTFALNQDGPALLTLGGRSWVTTHVDWNRRRAYVEPTDMKGSSQWISIAQPMHFELCQAIQAELCADEARPGLSQRAEQQLDDMRDDFAVLQMDRATLEVKESGEAVWWTFAGAAFNAAMAAILADQAPKVAWDNFAVTFSSSADAEGLRERIAAVLKSAMNEPPQLPLDTDFVAELKFGACLPKESADRVLRCRYSVAREWESIRSGEVGLSRAARSDH